MTVLVKHSKVSTIPDADDTSLVRPSDWNADHVVVGAAASGANSDITSMTGVTGGISSPDYIQFDTNYATPLTEGQLGWDGNDTLAVGMAGGNVIQHIGEDQFIYIKADAAITKGQVIMFTGAVGASGVLTGAPATGVTNPQYIMGIAAEDLAHNAFGLVQTFGEMTGINTNSFNEGDVLYYDSAVTGGYTNIFPASGPIVLVAAVAKKSSGNGTLVVRISVTQRIVASTGISVSQSSTGTTITNTSPSSGGTVTSITAGSGLSGGTITSSGTIALDINSLSGTTVAADDLVPVYDVSATANADCTASDIAGLGVGSIGYKTNNYYFGYLMNGVGVTTTLTSNRIYYLPFYVRKKTTFTRIGFQVTVTSGLIARFGIYNAENGVPTSLLLDCGTVSTSSTGDKEATISVTLNTGFYFLSVVPDATPTVYLSNFVSQISGYAVGQSSRTVQFYAYVAANGSTTLPNPAQTSLLELQSGLPGISLRVV